MGIAAAEAVVLSALFAGLFVVCVVIVVNVLGFWRSRRGKKSPPAPTPERAETDTVEPVAPWTAPAPPPPDAPYPKRVETDTARITVVTTFGEPEWIEVRGHRWEGADEYVESRLRRNGFYSGYFIDESAALVADARVRSWQAQGFADLSDKGGLGRRINWAFIQEIRIV